MIKDRQVKRLWRVLLSGKTLAQSADQTNMDEKTARKYRELRQLPSEVASERRGGPGKTRLPPSGRKCMCNCKRRRAWKPRRCLRGSKASTRGSSTTRSCEVSSVG